MRNKKKLDKYEKKISQFGDLIQSTVKQTAILMLQDESLEKAVFNDMTKQFLKQYRNTPSQQIIFIEGYSPQKNLLALQLATETNQNNNVEVISCTFETQEFMDYLRSIPNREVKPIGINRVILFETTRDVFKKYAIQQMVKFVRMYQIDIIFTSGHYIPLSFYNYHLLYFGYNDTKNQFRFLVKTKGEYIGYVVLHNTLSAETIKKFDDEMDRYMNELMGRVKRRRIL